MASTMLSWLEQARSESVLVAETCDLEAIRHFRPQHVSISSTLIFQAINSPRYQAWLRRSLTYATVKAANREQVTHIAVEKLKVIIALDILREIPGRVCVEVDPSIAYDVAATADKVHRMLEMLQEEQLPEQIAKHRVMFKICATWEGIQAARQLEREGIHCTMNMVMSLAQAQACAEARATLISTLIGRIYDFYFKENKSEKPYDAEDDPGVNFVMTLFNYYKHKRFRTGIMPASFRFAQEVTQLIGCDYICITPQLMEWLDDAFTLVKPKNDFLDAVDCKRGTVPGPVVPVAASNAVAGVTAVANVNPNNRSQPDTNSMIAAASLHGHQQQQEATDDGTITGVQGAGGMLVDTRAWEKFHPVELDEQVFRIKHAEDQMAVAKVDEGVRRLSQEAEKLMAFLEKLIDQLD